MSIKGIYDIHCHIVPGVDDGATDIGETVKLLRMEYEQGVRTVIATPHFRFRMFETPAEKVREQFRLVEKAASEISPDLHVYLGCEFHANMEMLPMLREQKVMTMAGSRYVLTEFSHNSEESYIRERLGALLLIRNGSVRNLFTLGIYRNVMIFVILVDLFLIILFESYKGVLRRRRYQELRSVIRQMILIELASGLYLFTVSGGHTFSRIILYLMGIIYVLLSYCTRIIWKKRLLHKMAEGGEHSLYIVTNYDLASKVIQNVKEHNYNRYNINGLILIDKDMTGKEIAGVPVVADLNNASSFICQQWVDEVFVNVDETYPYPQELIEELLEMGMPVHVNLAKVRSTPGQKQFVEAIGGYTVLTTTMNYATDRQALAKRALDILGGLVGCILTGVIFIFIAPAIYISSPGPIFFSQTRIGKNGKPFKMYKFRSMYMDAEERKAELMSQNKMSDGRMFKLDFDPRVIGNKILPDGTRKTGIGEFIRKTSLDEFPQFWNVLNGSMSLVGTRPILQDELRQYELHHRARIAIKPGITGMWQVSGRSDITDFEEVVRLDTEYINSWSFSLDIKILFKTVIMVLKREGSV